MSAGLVTPTTTGVLGAEVELNLAEETVTDAWSTLFASAGVQEAFVDGVNELAEGQTYLEFHDDLKAQGIDPLNGAYRSLLARTARGEESAYWDLLRTTRGLGTKHGTVADLLNVAGLFANTKSSTTIVVRLTREFYDVRRDQRTDLLELVATLGSAFDVRLVATRLTQRWLACEHREDLPGVSEWCNNHQAERPLGELIDRALDTLDPDGRDVQVLRAIIDEPAATLSYSQLYGLFDEIDDSRIRQCVSRLTGLDLVEPFGPQSGRMVEARKAGFEFLDSLDADIGRQIELGESVSETPNSHNRPCNPTHGRGGENGSEYYTTAYLDQPNHAAAAATGRDGTVTLVDGPENHAKTADTDRTRYVSYDGRRDEAVIAVRATGALQHVVSVATALADPMLVDKALPLDRLDSITLSESVLRDARCIGCLSDEALEDPETLRDALVEWGNDLKDYTRQLKYEEYDDRDEFRSAIMQSAHGFAGSIIHLLDVANVDIVREIRVPNGLTESRLTGLTESIWKTATIQSRYGHYAAYRQLFEDRDEKRDQALEVSVDAADPYGKLIGGFVVHGPGVDRLRPHLEARLGSDEDPVEDAPEFAIDVTIRNASRDDFAAAASRICSRKNLSLSRETTSVLHALAASPHAAAQALQQLDDEDQPRDLRPDEVRYALATLGSSQLLPDFPASVGKIVLALLEATEPLTQADLADRAGVSTQTVRNYRTELEALGLLNADDGYRLVLSTSDERREEIVPSTVENGSLLDAVDTLLSEVLPPDRYGDPEDKLGSTLFWPPDPWLLEGHADLAQWFDVAVRLVDADRPSSETVVTMGPSIEQQPVPTGGDSEVIE